MYIKLILNINNEKVHVNHYSIWQMNDNSSLDSNKNTVMEVLGIIASSVCCLQPI